MDKNWTRNTIWALAAAAVGLAGCQAAPSEPDSPATGTNKFQDTLAKTRPADAGVELGTNPSEGLPDSPTKAKTMAFASRNDPFSLLAAELKFDRAQAAERLQAESGGFNSEYSEPEETEAELPRLQPKPAWRLSGIIISEGGVVGLLDMGTEVIQIRPGMSIPNSPYTVVSVDGQRAVLRRNDGQLPKDITIELSGPIGGGGQLGGGNAGAPPAGAGGGRRGPAGFNAPGAGGGKQGGGAKD
ncbi:MAG: hypothetical protein JSS65_09195 [Armatimonadetes bacterium]|nr:hypothetical protein [Armatimonadota bacterium]